MVCGVSRLARFNVTAAALSDATTGKVKYFQGTPIPTSILHRPAARRGGVDRPHRRALWLGAWHLGPAVLHPLTLLFGFSGSAMISATLKVPKP